MVGFSGAVNFVRLKGQSWKQTTPKPLVLPLTKMLKVSTTVLHPFPWHFLEPEEKERKRLMQRCYWETLRKSMECGLKPLGWGTWEMAS